MKKKILLFLVCLLLPLNAYADEIYNVKIDAYIDQFGTIHVTEKFNAKATEGNNWCKKFNLQDNQEISNVTIYIDNNILLDSNSSNYNLEKNKDGTTSLCFSKTNYNYHEYVLDYELSNMIFKTEEEDILYWKVLPEITANNLGIIIMGYYDFEEDLDIYDFGYEGVISISDGKIYTSNQEKITDGYATILVKFPKGTFDTKNTYNKYKSFSSVLKEINTNSINMSETKTKKMIFYIIGYMGFALIIISIIIISKDISYNKYGYKNNLKINKKLIDEYKNIPRNIYYSNTLLKLNKIDYIKTNIFGSMLTNLLNNNKISIENNKIVLLDKNISNQYEKELFNILQDASIDNYLTNKEMETWCNKNYNKLLNLFNKTVNDNIEDLEDSCRIYKRKYKKECIYKKVMDGIIYKDSIKLYGLEKYLINYINNDISIDESKIKDYIEYSYIFNLNNKFIKKITSNYKEYDKYEYINTFTKRIIKYINNLKEEK